MNLTATKPDRKTAMSSATFGDTAPVKYVEDADTGERLGWMRPFKGMIDWKVYGSSTDQVGLADSEAEALVQIEAAVLAVREAKAADAAYVAEVMALPEPARTARRNRDKAVVLVEIERQRIIIRPDDLERAERSLALAESELSDAMAVVNRRAA